MRLGTTANTITLLLGICHIREFKRDIMRMSNKRTDNGSNVLHFMHFSWPTLLIPQVKIRYK
jgi:hypothetical protein